ncbi:MAG: hypothetical protein CVT81_02305 [Alphaproteobacteria bacterium HGW-Alphaproteobacteria-3]|nr:MAG: hypothetical protein CVT81_02305 [Alphaproteobacteria bacterium HGW-Alphaproteobacteria-3]
MPLWARVGFVFYFAVYHLLGPAIAQAFAYQAPPYVELLILAEALHVFLLLLPVLFYHPSYGWLHPLIFPSIFVAAKSVLKDPVQLIDPLRSAPVSFDGGSSSRAFSISTLSDADLSEARIWLTLLYCFALAVYYAAFFWGPRFRVPRIAFRRPSNQQVKWIAAAGLIILVCSAFIVSQGGLAAQIAIMRGGRSAAFSGLGQFLVLAGLGVMVMLSWLAFDRSALRNPLFWGMLMVALVNTVVVSGARSALIYPLVMFMMIWWMQTGRARIGVAAIAAVVSLFFFGLAGIIRQDYGATDVDWSILDPTRAAEWIEAAREEAEWRGNEESDLAAFAGVDDAGLLMGRTYLGAAAFWIPRAIWPDKPRSADSYNMYVNFVGREIGDEFEVRIWGIPVGAEVEAFWNFHLPGVVLIFFFLGAFHRWLANLFVAYPGEPAIQVLYAYVLVNFVGTSMSFVTTIRMVLALLVLYSVFGALGVVRRRRMAPVLRS